jgi:hypothetical protein
MKPHENGPWLGAHRPSQLIIRAARLGQNGPKVPMDMGRWYHGAGTKVLGGSRGPAGEWRIESGGTRAGCGGAQLSIGAPGVDIEVNAGLTSACHFQIS